MTERLKVSLRTAASIRALLTRLEPLPPGYDRVHFDNDLPGYGLRARASGTHSLMIQYPVGKKQRSSLQRGH